METGFMSSKVENISLLEKYIKSWLIQDKEMFLNTLNDKVDIRECYGASYACKSEAEAWFTEWNKRGKVLDWKILDVFFDSERCLLFATWEFNHRYPGINEPRFDGITMMAVENGKITLLYEYETRHERFYPYKERV